MPALTPTQRIYRALRLRRRYSAAISNIILAEPAWRRYADLLSQPLLLGVSCGLILVLLTFAVGLAAALSLWVLLVSFAFLIFYRRVLSNDPPPTRRARRHVTDRSAQRVASALHPLYVASSLFDDTYDTDQEGAYSLEGLVREALAAPWAISWHGSVNLTDEQTLANTLRVLSALDTLDDAGSELAVYATACVSSIHSIRYHPGTLATTQPRAQAQALLLLEALVDMHVRLRPLRDAPLAAQKMFAAQLSGPVPGPDDLLEVLHIITDSTLLLYDNPQN